MNRGTNDLDMGRKSVKGKFRLFFENGYLGNKINSGLAILGIGANIINWLILLILLKPATENIILHYNVYFGVDMIGKRFQVFILPGVGLIIFIINFIFLLYSKIAKYKCNR